MRRFQVHIFQECKTDSTAAIVALIMRERQEQIIDKSLVKSLVQLYEAMGMREDGGEATLDAYENDLEAPLLATTRDYYAQKRADWLGASSTPDFLIKAEHALQEEEQRVADYLNASTESKLLSIVEGELLAKAEMNLLEKESSGCLALLRNE